MVSKITPQSTSLTGQSGTDALLRNENNSQATTEKNAAAANPKKKLSASYEVTLSEAGQAKAASPLPSVNSPEEAKRQLDLIKAAADNAGASLANLHKTDAKSVMDLLA